MADADSGRDIRAVGRAVDDGRVHVSVVEYGGDVVDDLIDGERFGWQVGAGVVVARHSHSAVLDHDDVQTGGREAPAQSLVHAHRRHTRDRPGGSPAGGRTYGRCARSTDRTRRRCPARPAGVSAARRAVPPACRAPGGVLAFIVIGVGPPSSPFCRDRWSAARRLPSAEDQVGGFLPDQHRRRMGVAANRARHHRGVGDPKSIDSPDPQLRIHHTRFVAAHPAGAQRVIQRVRAGVEGPLRGSASSSSVQSRGCATGPSSLSMREPRRSGRRSAALPSSRPGRCRRDRSSSAGR